MIRRCLFWLVDGQERSFMLRPMKKYPYAEHVDIKWSAIVLIVY